MRDIPLVDLLTGRVRPRLLLCIGRHALDVPEYKHVID
jgi:hypothetical protein